MGKVFEHSVYQGAIEIAKKHIKSDSTSLILRKMPSITKQYHYIAIRKPIKLKHVCKC